MFCLLPSLASQVEARLQERDVRGTLHPFIISYSMLHGNEASRGHLGELTGAGLEVRKVRSIIWHCWQHFPIILLRGYVMENNSRVVPEDSLKEGRGGANDSRFDLKRSFLRDGKACMDCMHKSEKEASNANKKKNFFVFLCHQCQQLLQNLARQQKLHLVWHLLLRHIKTSYSIFYFSRKENYGTSLHGWWLDSVLSDC